MSLNVLVDGYNLELPQGTGIKTYSENLLSALKHLGYSTTVLTSRQINPQEPLAQYQLLTKYKCYRVSNLLFKGLRIKSQFKIKQANIDIWHATYPLPITIKNTLKITTIHDLIPLKLPHLTLDNKRFFKELINISLQESHCIVTVSESTKKDIIELFNYPEEKIHVTYQPTIFRKIDSTNNNILEKYQLEKNNYILFVGAIEPKKNVQRIIEAYQQLRLKQPLVIIGKKAWLWQEELKNINTSSVILLDYVSKQELQYFYQGATCFIFPSLYEGFGLPVLEAMSFGTPVITSNISSLPEVAGDAALYVDPYNTQDIAEKLNYLINNNELREKLSKATQQRAKIFTMEKYLQKIAEIYQNLGI